MLVYNANEAVKYEIYFFCQHCPATFSSTRSDPAMIYVIYVTYYIYLHIFNTGTMGHEPIPGKAEKERGKLYRFNSGMQPTETLDKVSMQNDFILDFILIITAFPSPTIYNFFPLWSCCICFRLTLFQRSWSAMQEHKMCTYCKANWYVLCLKTKFNFDSSEVKREFIYNNSFQRILIIKFYNKTNNFDTVIKVNSWMSNFDPVSHVRMHKFMIYCYAAYASVEI